MSDSTWEVYRQDTDGEEHDNCDPPGPGWMPFAVTVGRAEEYPREREIVWWRREIPAPPEED